MTSRWSGDQRSQQSLDAGSHLVCVRSYCAGVEVLPDHVTTMSGRMLEFIGIVEYTFKHLAGPTCPF
jgi:hypothetical protein